MSQPDFQPTLTGDTVVIRPIRSGDWQELFAAASDPEIWKLHPARMRYTEPVFREFFDNAIASKMAFVFVERASGRLIGSSRYSAMTRNRARSRSAGHSSSAITGAGGPTAR